MRRLFLLFLLGLTQVALADYSRSPTCSMTASHHESASVVDGLPLGHAHVTQVPPGHDHPLPAVEECEDDFGEDLSSRILLDSSVPCPPEHGRAPQDSPRPRTEPLVRSLPIRGPPAPARG